MIRSSRSENKSPSVDNSAINPGGNVPLMGQSTSSISAAPASVSKDAQPVAVIGPKIRFKGELVGEEDLLIQGQVDGTIDLKGNHLIIGKQGVVKANVLAQTIVIEGTVEGDVFGEDRISICASSNVKGNLVADRVTLEDGAKFKGSIDMDIELRKDDFQKFNQGSTISAPSPRNSAPNPINPPTEKPSTP